MKIETITNSYKDNNEDIHGKTEHAFWIIDGALPLSKAKFTKESSDVIWMVHWWHRYLSNHLEQFNKSIVTILEEGMVLLNTEFSQYADISNLSKLDRASATIAIVRINSGFVESYVLGDSEINIRTQEGKIKTIIDEKIEALDQEVIDMIFNNKERKNCIAFNGYTDEELKVLRQNRMKMNSKEGYYILEHDIEGIKHGIYSEIELSKIQDILMMSDGYSAIYSKYKKMTLTQLMDSCKSEGLEAVLNQIRSIEDNDVDFTAYKRLRVHDDATAIYIDL
ncbi:protein phosphatase 2C domain-containing protein [Fusibacter sp. 3D3]|uniref:protein phosphatase 2C domain-containing protein n=1 Tax=Fusibacter sp. 3D3 TaxID=1048380 RepID=UPI000852FFC4|nr:protein phosphatase 2C domain-containing protein [Fusibacter sp. 3D3]GAU79670.1 hypothetical protein F3D3_4334 [Fusibacter sp. 3D3]